MMNPLALLAIALILVYLFLTRNFNYWKKRNVPFIKPIPLFGSLLPLFGMKQVMGEWMADISKQTGKDYFGLYLFGQPALMIQSPQLIKAVLQKDFANFQDRFTASFDHEPTMSNMMYFTKNPKWKTLRTSMNPVFSSGKLKQMFSVMLNESEEMGKYLSKFAEVPDVESKEICAKYATNAIAKSIFAVDANCFGSEKAEFREIGRRMFDFRVATAIRTFATWLAPKFADFLRIGLFESYVVNSLNSIIEKVLITRNNSATRNGNDMVDILMKSDNNEGHIPASYSFISGQGLQMFAAAFETISGTISFTLYELCIQPKIQNQLRSELMETIAKYDGKITYESLGEMKYLDMCVSETLRKYPALPFLSRTCTTNYKVPGSDLVIEKGIPVLVPMFALNYNPEHFPEPQRYIPERFEDKFKINCEGFSYIPFGEGPRICIGARYGLLAVKVGLASILSKYSVVPSDQTPIPLKFEVKSLILQSEVGVPMKFVPLHKGSYA